jgi:hypothetical protein
MTEKGKAGAGADMGGTKAGRAAQGGDRMAVWISLAALVLLPLIFYAAMIFGGKEPASPDTMAVRPLGAWAREATRTIGGTPLWIPYLFSGMPSYGSYVYTPANVLSPLDALLRPFADARGVRYFIFLLLGAFSGYAFFRRQGVSAPAAAAASLGFVMSAYVPGVIESGHSTKLRAMMHVPLLLLALDIFLDRPRPLAAAFLSLSAAMLGWSNHPQIFYYAAIIGVIYAGGRLIAERDRWPAPRLALAAGWIIASGTLAFFLISEPTLAVREYASYSIRGTSEGGGATWEYATAWSFSPREVVSFLFPEFFGLKGATYFGELPFTQSTHYFGIAALALGIFGFARRRDARSWIWLFASLVILLVGFGQHLPILYGPFYKLLPYFNKFRVPSMFYSLLPLAFGYLVARGIDALSLPPEDRRRTKGANDSSSRRWLLAAAVAAGIAVVALVVGMAGKAGAVSGSGWIRPEEAGRYSAEQLNALRGERWDMRTASLFRGFILLAVLFAAVPYARRLRRPAGAALLGLILVVDLWIVGAKFLEYGDKGIVEETIRPTADIDLLKRQSGLFRVLPLDDFASNRYAAFRIASAGGYQPAKLRIYQDLIDQQLLRNPSVLAMLNVKYVVSSQSPNHPSFTSIGSDVYEFRDALPRAWFVPAWRTVPDQTAVLRAMGARDFNPAADALFSQGRTPGLPSSGLDVSRSVTVERSDERGVEIKVGDGTGPGLLIVSEIYYPPGWRATIDGKTVPILQANHVLRAVEIPAGPHSIEMRAESRMFRMGRLLNRVGGISLVLLAAFGFVMERRRQERIA